MLNKDFINRCLQEELASLNEDKTLREFLAEYFQYGIEDELIEKAMKDEFKDLIIAWGDDNGMTYKDMYNFIMKSLDCKVDYDIKVDAGYDPKPNTWGLSKTNELWKEVRFSGNVIVNNISLDLDEWYKDFEVA